MSEPEVWRDIPGLVGYQASNQGRVRSLPGNGRLGKDLTPHPNTGGYLSLSILGGAYAVHRLVMITFVGPRPDGMQVRHLDGNKSNNRFANLAYGTASENGQDTVRLGRHPLAIRDTCNHGHLFDEKNTGRRANGSRRCRKCSVEKSQRYYRRKKAAS